MHAGEYESGFRARYTGAIDFEDKETPRIRFATSDIVKKHPEEVGSILSAIAQVTGMGAASHAWVDENVPLHHFGLTSEQVLQIGYLLGVTVRGWNTIGEVVGFLIEMEQGRYG